MSSSLFAPTLETSRLRLRPLQVQDADALLAIFSDPEVMKYWNTAPWTHSSDALDFISAAKQGKRASPLAYSSGIPVSCWGNACCSAMTAAPNGLR